ncbi:DNA replication protein [Pantoea sp. Al-1710]|uniref:DNA replication protein n=1 Tax=Candidatus Pantoea communis TaxID=2608354 RepID=A0ABX0RI42_9GAMM|nr:MULTISPECIES: replication protein P [Pantoea]NIG12974.1 DNA replication protein [Pantoea sp. Cy-640]NIG17325.1 DNA replication protein [Pantoea communis]
MKQIAEAIKQRDAVQLSLIAQSHPEKKTDSIPPQAIEIFNDIFKQLRAIFPAMMATIKDQEQLNELRRQWVKAIAENHIYCSAQIEAGMRRARQHEKPFLPSPGEFVSWCKEGESQLYGLPKPEELYDTVMNFRARRFQYPCPEKYPWSSHAEYWLVTAVSSKMTALALTVSATMKVCESEIKRLGEKIRNGFIPPEPVPQVEKKVIVTSPDVALSYLANMRAMIKASH